VLPPRRHFLASARKPFFFYTRAHKQFLTRKTNLKQFRQHVKQLRKKNPALTVLRCALPPLPAYGKNPAGAPSKAWQESIHRLKTRIGILHKHLFHVALQLPERPTPWSIQLRHKPTMFALLDQLNLAYPVLWIADLRTRKDLKSPNWLSASVREWTMQRLYMSIVDVQKKAKNSQKNRPIQAPPLVIARLGKPRSEQRLKQAEQHFAMLWLKLPSLLKELQDFKLMQRKRPMLLTWSKLKQLPQQVRKAIPKVATTKSSKQHQRWAAFLWKAHMLGFHHTGPPIDPSTLKPEPTQTNTNKSNPNKPSSTPPKFSQTQKIPMILRAFFQRLDWTKLQAPTRSIQLAQMIGFGAETLQKKASSSHHMVFWLDREIQGKVSFTRKRALRKHRYLWLDPMTGRVPLQPQLLPPKPPKGKRDQLQVPFRPAVLYVF
ncbi:MAG: hypothetical protein AAGJ35_12255, partial [Myxococcota bacterium]